MKLFKAILDGSFFSGLVNQKHKGTEHCFHSKKPNINYSKIPSRNLMSKYLKLTTLFIVTINCSVVPEAYAANSKFIDISVDQSIYAHVDSSISDTEVVNKTHYEQSESDIPVFQLISHGRPGELYLDGQWRDARRISQWLTDTDKLASAEHLNIYGCEFAKGNVGRAAVIYLENELGITISASDDITGIDGDWELEVGNAVDALALNDYQGNLQDTDGDLIPDLTDLDDDNDGILDAHECPVTTRMNAGTASTFTDVQGRVWDGETGYFVSGGPTATTGSLFSGTNSGAGIGDTTDNAIYRSVRVSGTYAFIVASGIYTVVVHYGEGFPGGGAIRFTTVNLEGTAVETNLNFLSAYGSEVAATETYTGINVTDGVLDVVVSGSGNPYINAIEIIPQIGIGVVIDADSDGLNNCLDIDSDNDGIPDNVEAQTTAGYLAPIGTVVAATGIDTQYSPSGLTPVDTDGDGNFDYLDGDADGDGLSDAFERTATALSNNPDTGDTDGDGLLNEYEGADVNDGFDVNDEINAPGTDLADSDSDCCTTPLQTDMDYRDLNVSQTVTKVGTATSTASTTQVDETDTIDWVIEYSNSAGGVLQNIELSDALSGDHTIVAGSQQAPPGWVFDEQSINNVSFNVASVGDGTSAITPLSPVAAISNNLVTGGDGFVVVVGPDSNLYLSYHHKPAIIQCIDPVSGGLCANYLAAGNALPPTAAQTGDGTQGYIAENPHNIQFIGTRYYYPVTRGLVSEADNIEGVSTQINTLDWGLGCMDTATSPPSPCSSHNNAAGLGIAGYFELGPEAGYAPINVTSGGIAGPYVYNNQLYMFDNGMYLHCYDPANNAECSGYPLDLSSATTFPRLLGDGSVNVQTATLTGKQDGSRLYLLAGFVGRDVIAGHTDVEDYRVRCIDLATGASCAGWSATEGVQIAPTGRVAGDSALHRHGTVYESFLRRTPSGDVDAICLYAHSGGVGCVDTSGNPFTTDSATHFYGIPDSIHNVLRGNTASGVVARGMLHEITVDNRMYWGDFYENGVFCWDWDTNDWCAIGTAFDSNADGIFGDTTTLGTSTETGVAFLSSGQATSDYGPTYDPNTGCFWSLGDTNVLWSFDAVGNNPCASSGAGGVATVDPVDYFCSTDLASVTWSWDKFFVNDANFDEWASASVDIIAADGATSLVNCDMLAVPASGPFPFTDGTGCVYSDRYTVDLASMTALVPAQERPLSYIFNGNVPTSTDIFSAGRSPSLGMDFDSSQSAEFCFQTLATDIAACEVSGLDDFAANSAEVRIAQATTVDSSVGPVSLNILRNNNSSTTDSDGDGLNDSCDLDDDNDGIPDVDEGLYCLEESFEDPVYPVINGNNIIGNTFGDFFTQNGGTLNVIRVDGSEYINGANNAQDGSQYIDINQGSDYLLAAFTVPGTAMVDLSAWLSNRDDVNYVGWSGQVEILDSNFNVVASGNTIDFLTNTNPSEELWFESTLSNYKISTPGDYYFRVFVQNYGHTDNISICVVLDTDDDGTPDYLDLDSDNDGCSDAYEAGATTDTTADFQFPSSPVGTDGIPDAVQVVSGVDSGAIDYTIAQTNPGVNDFQDLNVTSACTEICDGIDNDGNGIIDDVANGDGMIIDTDGDNVYDSCDLDDDNDGIPDTVEYGSCSLLTNASFELPVINSGSINSSPTIDDWTITGTNIVNLLSGVTAFGNPAAPDGVQAVGLQGTGAMSQDITVTETREHVLTLQAANRAGNNQTVEVRVGGVTVDSININSTSYVPVTVSLGTLSPGTHTIELAGIVAADQTMFIDDLFIQDYCDTDNDGTPDYLDTDSDNDGCFDASEAGHGETYDTNGMIDGVFGSNGLDADIETDDTFTAGINYTVAATGGVNDFQNAAVMSCDVCTEGASTDGTPTPTDSDGDGVNDSCDLDDDNDGITDADEGYCNTADWLELGSASVVNYGGPAFDIFTMTGGTLGTHAVSATAISGEYFLGIALDGPYWDSSDFTPSDNPSEDLLDIASVDPNSYGSNIMRYDFSPAIINPTIQIKGLDFHNMSLTDQNNNPVVINVLSSSTDTSVVGNVITDIDPSTTGADSARGSFEIRGTISSLFVEYNQNPGSSITDGNNFSISQCISLDTDNDGTPDYLDTDSDNDGCFDAAESGHGQSYDVNGMLDGVFGANGLDVDVETDDTFAASNNYTLAATGGVNDFQNDAETGGCAVSSVIDLSKTITSGPTDNGNGTYTVEYAVTASETGGGAGTYDVIDNFMPGAGITLISATIAYGSGEMNDTGVTAGTVITDGGTAVDDEALGANASETWVITAIFNVDSSTVTSSSADCSDDTGENGNTGFANSVSASATDTDTSNDTTCAALPLGNITGAVWLDDDGDGVNDNGEPGIAGVTVYVCAASASPCDSVNAIATSVTDANGDYNFPNLPAGDYQVQVEPTELDPTNELDGLSEAPGNVAGGSGTISLAEGATEEVEFGYVPDEGTGVVEGTVWSDADGDGIQDPDEVGIEGVTVFLCAPDEAVCDTGTAVGTAVTGPDGSYIVTGVPEGEYVAVVDTATVPTGFVETVPTTSDPFTVEPDGVVSDIDFGFDSPDTYEISDQIWNDADGDGVLDSGESSVPGVTVDLVDINGNVIATTTTDANGEVNFTGVPDGEYQLVVTDNTGELNGMDETTTTGGTTAITVAGADMLNASSDGGTPSFGYNEPGTISGSVFSDADSDGVLTTDESGIAVDDLGNPIVIELQDGTCTPSVDCPTATVNADGTYQFDGVDPGGYTVVITNPPAGTSTTGNTLAVTVPTGGSATDIDFGYNDPTLDDITGTIFYDVDTDGTNEPDGNDGDPSTTDDNETGIGGVTLDLVDCGADGICGGVNADDDVVVASTTTNPDGSYDFVDVPDGDYTVAVTDVDNVLDGYELTSGLDELPVTADSTTPGDPEPVDFGYVDDQQTSSISSGLWIDEDGDGIRGPDELPISGVDVQLLDCGDDGVCGTADDGPTVTATTDPDGNVIFTDLPPGNYMLDVDETDPDYPDGLDETAYPAGIDPSAPISLSEGEAYDADFGYVPTDALLGGTVWTDANSDGIQDPGEIGIGGVTVVIRDGTTGAIVTTVVTNPDGSWTASVPAGDYAVSYNPGDISADLNPDEPTNMGDENNDGITDVQYVVSGVTVGDIISDLDFGFGPNEPPLADDDYSTTSVDTPVLIDVITNDSDPDGDPITITTTSTTSTGGGTVVCTDPAGCTYTPPAGVTDIIDTFTYEICEPGLDGVIGTTDDLCDTATVTVVVGDPVGDNPPIASDDSESTMVDTPVTLDILGNDGDPDGDPITITPGSVSDPVNGTVVCDENPLSATFGECTYTPDPGFTGTDTFTYEICDPGPLCDTATVVIEVEPDNNQPPLADDDVDTTPINTPVTVPVTGNDSDPDDDPIVITPSTTTSTNGGTVMCPDPGDATSCTYTPPTDFVGIDTFTYEVCDDGTPPLCDTATVTVVVGDPGNLPPIASDDSESTDPDVPVNIDVIGNDGDPDGDPITVDPATVTTPTNGTATCTAAGVCTYTPASGFEGTDTFTYEVCDAGIDGIAGNADDECDTATVTVVVGDTTNLPPIANDDSDVTDVDTPVVVDIFNNDGDPDGDPITITPGSVSDPVNGTVVCDAAGMCTYTPDAGFTGTDTFTYEVCDDGTPPLCDTATVTIVVGDPSPDNDPPLADDDYATTPVDTNVDISVIDNDSDPDGDPITVDPATVSTPSNGTATCTAAGVCTYDPDPGFEGIDIFTYDVCDDGTPPLCDTATVTVVIGDPSNQPPLADDDFDTTPINTPVTVPVTGNDSDPDGDPIVITPSTPTSTNGGTVVCPDPGDASSCTYTPPTDFVGTDTFTYEICDDGTPPLCDTATVTVVVGDPGNLPPIATDDNESTDPDTPVVIDILNNDGDPNGDPITITPGSVSDPANGMVTCDAAGMCTYTPDSGFTGTDTFTYEICDDGTPALCDTATVTIIVGEPSPGEISGTVYLDEDASSTNDGEPGIEQVTVSLVDCGADGICGGANAADDTVIATVPTDINGDYSFTGVPDGSYEVVVTDTNNATIGLNPTQNAGGSVPVSVTGGVQSTSTDFGYAPEGNSIGNLIWLEVASINDGIFTPEEGDVGLPGVTVECWYDTDGNDIFEIGGVDNLIRTVETDTNGEYYCEAVPTGGYFVRVTDTNGVLSGFGPATVVGGSADNTNKAAIVDTAGAPTLTPYYLDTASPNYTADFAVVSAAMLTGVVYDNTNTDGDTDYDNGTDVPISGALVTVTYTLGGVTTTLTATTDSTGAYSIDVPTGVELTVTVDPAGTSVDGYDASGENPVSITVPALNSGDNVVNNFGFEEPPIVTNPITLGYFLAQPDGSGGIAIDWQTVTETGNVGFHLYGKARGQSWQRLNSELIISRVGDSVEVQHYRYQVNGKSVTRFAISDIDLFGKETLHGPYRLGKAHGVDRSGRAKTDWRAIRDQSEAKKAGRKAKRKAKRAKRMQRLEQQLDSGERQMRRALKRAKRLKRQANREVSVNDSDERSSINTATDRSLSWRSRLVGAVLSLMVPAAHAQVVNPVTDPGLVYLKTSEAGIYRVTYEQLEGHGLDLAGVRHNRLAVMHRGEKVAVRSKGQDKVHGQTRYFGPGGWIEFIADAQKTLYTKQSVYALYNDRNRRKTMARDATKPNAGGTEYTKRYTAVAEMEPDLRYLQWASDDPWYATRLVSTSAPKTHYLPIEMDHIETGEVTVNLEAFGGYAGIHTVSMQLNDHAVGSLVSSDFDQISISGQTTTAALLEGLNRVNVTLTNSPGQLATIIHTNKWSVSYPRKLVAVEDQLIFSAQAPRFEMTNLSHKPAGLNRRIYRKQSNGEVVWVQRVGMPKNADGTYRMRFTGHADEATYYVATDSGVKAVEFADPVEQEDLLNGSGQYLVISHPDFIDSNLDDLLQARQAQGYSTKVVNVEAVYSAFDHGYFGADAVERYIDWAHQNLGTQMVLLVGSDTYDYHDNLNANSMSFMPSIYARTSSFISYAPVDAKYADIDDDSVPDISIGRMIPRSSDEWASIVSKTLQYPSHPNPGSIVFAVDKVDQASGYSFSADADATIAALPSEWQGNITRAYIDELGVSQARGTLINALNEGQAVAAMFGHSGPVDWTFEGLFKAGDAKTLTNVGAPTVVTQWGCWNTYYVRVTEDSLAHEFMLNGDGGAAAVLGASTLTEASHEREIAKTMYPIMFETGKPLGVAVLEAKRLHAQDFPNQADVILGWNLIGDPALVIEGG